MVVAAYGIGYAYAGWAIAFVSGVSYVLWVLQRGRKVSQRVPEGKRRWSDG